MFTLRLVLVSGKSVSRNSQVRSLSQLSARHKESNAEKMQAWQIHSYGDSADLKLSDVKIPIIRRPNDVLVKVQAASVNPIDLAISRGYGATILNIMRRTKALRDDFDEHIEFPLTLGRDFSGVVVSKGHKVGDRLTLGDDVWGVIPVEQQGCHAEYVLVDSSLVNPRPANLSHIEASSLLYAGLTAWSALWITGGLWAKTNIPTYQNRRVLVLGGSGGVGSLAIQLLTAWNQQVVTTCSSDAVELVERLGPHVVVDYKNEFADSQIIEEGPYDIILDCCNQGADSVRAKGYPHKTYITLNSPLLKNVDECGLIAGSVRNLGDLIRYNIPISENKAMVKWGFFVPSRTGLNVIQNFVEKNKIVPVIDSVYPFSDLSEAYEKVQTGHLRGKIVINMT